MLIKQIYEEYGLPIEKIINKEYKKLGLKIAEAMVLLALFSIYERRRTFSINAISKRVEYDKDEIAKLINSLEEKGFFSVILETTSDGKERESFSLDPAFKKINDLILKNYNDKKQELAATHIGDMIVLLENRLGRVLSAYEMELLRNWYLNDNLTHDKIEVTIKKEVASNRFSINHLDRILMATPIQDLEVDPKTAAFLDQLYKKIK